MTSDSYDYTAIDLNIAIKIVEGHCVLITETILFNNNVKKSIGHMHFSQIVFQRFGLFVI